MILCPSFFSFDPTTSLFTMLLQKGIKNSLLILYYFRVSRYNYWIPFAECYCATTLDGKINLPIGVDYINGLLNSKDTCQTIETKAAISQTCLGHIVSKKATNGILQETLERTSSCNECLERGEVCLPCIENGQKLIEPSLRDCTSCLIENRNV